MVWTPLFVDLTISELDKMASNNNVHIGKQPHFDGKNYDYWKIRMSMHLKAMGGKIWPIVRDGFVVLKQDEPSPSDNENVLTNDQAMNVFFDALDINEFNHIKNITTSSILAPSPPKAPPDDGTTSGGMLWPITPDPYKVKI
jgi:hypothetical protein